MSRIYSGRYHWDGWAKPDQTVERKESVALEEAIADGKRIYIDAARRVGKTTFVVNTAEKMKKPVLRIDLQGVATIERVIDAIIADVNRFLDDHPKIRERLHGSHKITSEIGTNLGVISMKLGGEKTSYARQQGQTISTVLNYAALVAKLAGAVMLVDEIQDIKNLPKESAGEVLGAISACSDPAFTKNETAWAFAGSNRHAMHQIFSGADSMFFQRTLNIPIGPIEKNVIIPFLNSRFGSVVPEKISSAAYEFVEGITGDLQRLYSAMHAATNGREVVTERDLLDAQRAVIEDVGHSHALTVSNFTDEQSAVIDLIAQNEVRTISQLADVAKKAEIAPDVVKAGLNKLLVDGKLHIPARKQTIERPEPILIHYLKAHSAREHRDPSKILDELWVQLADGGTPAKKSRRSAAVSSPAL